MLVESAKHGIVDAVKLCLETGLRHEDAVGVAARNGHGECEQLLKEYK